MHNCALHVRPYQALSFQLSDYCLFGIQIGFRNFKFGCDFSPFFGSIVDSKEVVYVNMRFSYEQYQLWLEVLNPSKVIGYNLCLQYLWSWNYFDLLMPMLLRDIIWTCKYLEGDTYAKLKPLLKGIHVVDWPFWLFDIESRCNIKRKLEGLNNFFFLQMLILCHCWSQPWFQKCIHVVDLDFIYGSWQTLPCIA